MKRRNDMKHYVVVLDWAVETDEAVTILGVTHTLEEAKQIFNEYLPEQKGYTEEYGYEVYADDDMTYEAGVSGEWRIEHTALYIKEVM
jgi:hypothetical protein